MSKQCAVDEQNDELSMKQWIDIIFKEQTVQPHDIYRYRYVVMLPV